LVTSQKDFDEVQEAFSQFHSTEEENSEETTMVTEYYTQRYGSTMDAVVSENVQSDTLQVSSEKCFVF